MLNEMMERSKKKKDSSLFVLTVASRLSCIAFERIKDDKHTWEYPTTMKVYKKGDGVRVD